MRVNATADDPVLVGTVLVGTVPAGALLVSALLAGTVLVDAVRLAAGLGVHGRVGHPEQAGAALPGSCQTAVPLTGFGTRPLTSGGAGG